MDYLSQLGLLIKLLNVYCLIMAVKRKRKKRLYVSDAHLPLCDTRFRTFDAYFVSQNPMKIIEYIRLSCSEFESLLAAIVHDIDHPRNHRFPITPRHRLALYLRYVGHGQSLTSLAQECSIGKTTAAQIVKEVAEAIVKNCYSSAFPPLTRNTWKESSERFMSGYGYPRGLACIDGKHVEIQAPSNTGSQYYNYKGHFSFVLLAACDSNLRILLFDLGSNGRCSDSGIFNNSVMKGYIERRGNAVFPATTDLDGHGPVPYHFLGDGGFALTRRMMRPYSQAIAGSDMNKLEFNRRYSSVRRLVENLFGSMANRFRILRRAIDLNVESSKTVVLSCMILHNALVDRYGNEGVLRRFPPLPLNVPNNHVPAQGGAVYRERMKNYFIANPN